MCERFVDLPEIDVLGVEGEHREPFIVHFESRRAVVGRPECGVVTRVKDRPLVTLVDLPINGRPVSLVWHKRSFARTICVRQGPGPSKTVASRSRVT